MTESGERQTISISSSGGQKQIKAQRYDLIPVRPLDLLAELYGNGAAKYAAHNWRRGYAWSLSYAAAMRHLTRFWNGEDIDPEMQLPHVTAAAFHLFALAQFMEDFPEFDDRFKPAAAAGWSIPPASDVQIASRFLRGEGTILNLTPTEGATS